MDPIDLLACVIRGDIVYAGSSYYLVRRDEGPLDLPEANIYETNYRTGMYLSIWSSSSVRLVRLPGHTGLILLADG